MKTFCLLLLLYLFVVPAHATNYYVATTGSDGAAGSIGSPFRNPQKCGDVMVAGDVCNIRGGAYSYSGTMVSPANSGTSGNLITYQNYPSESVTITLTAKAGLSIYHFDLTGRSYHKISGLTLVGGEGCVLMWAGSHFHNIDGNTCTGGQRGGIAAVGQAHDNWIHGNTIYHAVIENYPRGTINSDIGEVWGNCMTSIFGASRNLIENNTIYRCHGEGLNIGSGSGNIVRGNIVSDAFSVNIYVASAPNSLVENNFSYVSTDQRNEVAIRNQNAQRPLGIGVATEDVGGLSANIIIRNNMVINAEGCVWSFVSQSGNPISGIYIYNNTCVGNASGIKVENSGAGISNLRIRNNIITGAITGGDATVQVNPVPSGSTISDNIYNTTPANFCWGAGCTSSFASWTSSSGDSSSQSANPLLVGASIIPPRLWTEPGLSAPPPVDSIANYIEPYKPQASSPAINAGATLSGFSTDILGVTRPTGGAWEIGATETETGGPSCPSTPALVAQFGLDGSAVDTSGNSNNGSEGSGVTYVAGKYGQAASFAGTAPITIADSLSLWACTGFNISAWIKPANTPSIPVAVVSKNYKYFLYSNISGYCGSNVPVGGYNQGANFVACYGTGFTASVWAHYAVSFDGTNLALYKDGVNVSNEVAPMILSRTTGSLMIGGSEYGEFFQGLIDEVRIHNYARSGAQIITDMNTPINTLPPALAAATLKIGAGVTLKIGPSVTLKQGLVQ